MTPSQLPFLGGEILIGLTPSVFLPGTGAHALQIPNNPVFLGAPLFTQGFRLDSPGGFVMLNAQDFVLHF